MSEFDLAVRGGMLVTEHGRARLDLHVSDGRIAHIGRARPARREIDAGGLLVMPGMVETHAHLMDPGDPTREDFPTGTAAAALNGVTTILEHTHGHPVRTVQDLDAKREHLAGRSHIDFGLAAHAWPGMAGEAEALWRAGTAYFKLFTCTTHGIPGHDAASLQDWFERFARLGAACLVHCEDEALTAAAERRLHEEEREDPRIVPEWRNRSAEEVAAAVVGVVSRHAGAAVGIAHCSSPAIVAAIERERAAGARIAAEACPQYFLLREQDVDEHGPLRKFTPPARARIDADEDDMWRALRDGRLSFLSSDHAPSTVAQKQESSIWQCHFGLPGLDTTMPLLLDAAARGKLSLEDVVRVYSTAPARQYGLWPRKGALEPGADADLAIVDPDARWTISDDLVRSKAGWTPYAGRNVSGRVVQTLLNGESVAADGELLGAPSGRFLPGAGARDGRHARSGDRRS
jgi:dihydroorotase (multifunctional complex type)